MQHTSVKQKKTNIDISLIPAGIYLIKITDNRSIAIKKLVKE